ncbi:MAG: DUF2339 domain-containing protein, partial [Myxococcota bacterium]
MLTAALLLIGLILGAALTESFFGGATGALLGLLFARSIQTRKRMRALETTVEDLSRQLLEVRVTEADESVAKPPPVPVPSPVTEVPPVEATPLETPLSETPSGTSTTPPEPAPDAQDETAAPSEPTVGDKIAAAVEEVRDYVMGVNTVVQVGVIILLVGIGLLGKWAADNSLFPIEVRLALAVLFGIALIAIGWRLRRKRFGYAMSLQGGGVGIVYIVTFFAFRTFGLIDPTLAFVTLLFLTVASVTLALLQDAKALAVLGAIGGFLAPVLASTGSGSHVGLFSYYAVLNAGIVTVAWFKAWRELNLVGFVFTFGIGGLWGSADYTTEKFSTTQPFLILFVRMFTGIPVLYARRQAPKMKGRLDGT